MAGNNGMKYMEKSFSVPMGGAGIEYTPEEVKERKEAQAKQAAEATRIAEDTRTKLTQIQSQKKTKKLIPYAGRILVKRRKLDQTSNHIILPDEVAQKDTDIADVVAVAEQTFCDKTLIAQSEQIITGLAKKAEEGDGVALEALMKFKEYLVLVTLKPGDVLLIGKYIGTEFVIEGRPLTVMDGSGIYAKVMEI